VRSPTSRHMRKQCSSVIRPLQFVEKAVVAATLRHYDD
jgi:hypothetical protein